MARDILDYLAATRENGGSDLHMLVSAPPAARIDGKLVPLEEFDMDPQLCRDLIMAILTDTQRAKLEKDWELDFALNVEGVGRFRGNAHICRGNVEAAFRYVPSEAPELDTLGHSPQIAEFCKATQGLLLVTGMTGTGKSTTLAAMTRRILETRSNMVVTVEDPIEFAFEHKYGLIKQRQIGHDTHSFPAALRAALRQDVDVIVVSEMRDQESIAAALTAAETGHLVISTIHTRSCVGALDRVVDVFPANQQAQIITQLGGALIGVISQRLLPRADAPGRVMASEVMVVNGGIQAAIRDHRFEQVYSLMQVGASYGMHTFDDSLLHLCLNGHLALDEALLNARHPDTLEEEFKNRLRAQAAAAKR
jgi:twitching motility protein PilT